MGQVLGQSESWQKWSEVLRGVYSRHGIHSRQMAMVGSGCSACHSFTGHCPHEAPHGLGVLSIRSPSCSEPSIVLPQKKLNVLPRPCDLACLPPQIHLPSAPPSLPQSPWLPLLPHMKLPSQGFLPAFPSAIIISPTGITVPLSFRALLKQHP